jgi:hypothetical protein
MNEKRNAATVPPVCGVQDTDQPVGDPVLSTLTAHTRQATAFGPLMRDESP